MFAFEKLEINPFSDLKISRDELLTYTTANLTAMIANNPNAIFAERISATTTAANNLGTGIDDELLKIGLQKMRTLAKDAFLAALPDQITMIHSAVVAKYGPKSGDVMLIFPQGRSIFTQCRQEALKGHLTQMSTAINPYSVSLGQIVVDNAANLLATWTSLYQEASTAKQTAKGVAESRQTKRAALEVELYKNLAWVIYHFPADAGKLRLYCPQELLFNRASAVTPGVATLTLVNYNPLNRQADFTISAENAESFRVYRRMVGEVDFTLWAEDIVPVDGVATYSIGLNTAGNFEFVAEGVNGSRMGERSTVVLVQQTN